MATTAKAKAAVPTTTMPMVRQHHVHEDHDYYFGITLEDTPQVCVQAHQTYEEAGAVWTRLAITYVKDGEPAWPPMYGPVRLNLMRHDRGGILGVVEQLTDRLAHIDWTYVLDIARLETLRALDTELAVTSLGEKGEELPDAPYLVFPFVARSGVTILYGDGGTGKSTLALALGAEVSTGQVLISEAPPLVQGAVVYADYEDDDTQHANRVRAICRGHDINAADLEIFHVPLVRKVADEAKRIRKVIEHYGAELVIVDSVGMGRGGDAYTAEDTIRMFRALRSLDAPVLAIDHISKQGKANAKKGSPDPYGSVYTRNSARMMWFVERRAARLGDPWDYLAFTHTKANHVRKLNPRYLKLQYVNAQQETNDGLVSMIYKIQFEATDDQGMPGADEPTKPEAAISVKDSILFHFQMNNGLAESVDEVSEALDAKRQTVKRKINELVTEKLLSLVEESGTNYYRLSGENDLPIPF